MMQREDVKQAVVDALIEIQTSSGREVWDIDETMRPIGDLEGFDSLNTIEAVILLSSVLGQELDPGPILDLQAGHPPQLGVITDRICRQMGIHYEGNSV